MRALGDDVMVIGRARATRYAARRRIPGLPATIPLIELGDDAHATRHLATLHPIAPGGFYVEPEAEDAPQGLFDDLPWFLEDLRPQGFLGRLVPERHPELRAPADLRFWSSDDVLRYAFTHGSDLSGAFVVGEGPALERALSNDARVLPFADREAAYARICEDLIAQSPPGSSAAGERPKLLATRGGPAGPVPVLVKFSPRDSGQAARREAELLVCEHLALETLREHGHPAARSALLEDDGRVFLEVERFDRLPSGGRRGLVSLFALGAEEGCALRSWSEDVAALRTSGLVDAQALHEARWRECFGRLTANTDMHAGNLSFFARGAQVTGLAPAYDMLPMALAPRAGELRPPRWRPPAWSPSMAEVWAPAKAAAVAFWERMAADERLGKALRAVAAKWGEEVRGLGP